MSQAIDTLPASHLPSEAARRYRASGDPAHLAETVLSVIERHVDTDLRAKLHIGAREDLRLAEDLAIDSLTRMEIGLLAEDVLRINISYEELTAMHTVGDVQRFVAAKLAGGHRTAC